MTKKLKILLTIPSVLGLSYMFTFLFPTEFNWLVPSMKAYYFQVGALHFLTLVQLIFLLRKLWSFKAIEKSKKTEWTWLLLIYPYVTCSIFIWKKFDEFEKLNGYQS